MSVASPASLSHQLAPKDSGEDMFLNLIDSDWAFTDEFDSITKYLGILKASDCVTVRIELIGALGLTLEKILLAQSNVGMATSFNGHKGS